MNDYMRIKTGHEGQNQSKYDGEEEKDVEEVI